MAQEPTDRETIRKYLLAELAEPQRQALEERLLSDDAVFEELQVGEDELIDAYLKDELDADQKHQFETVFLATPERREKFRFGRAFLNYVSSQTVAKPAAVDRTTPGWLSQFFGSPARIAVYAILIVGIAIGTWLAFFRQSDVVKGLVALNNAYRQERPIEARISQFDYAPYSVTRGSKPEPVDTLTRDRAERILLDAVHDKPSAESYHALGKLYLTKKEFDKAIEQFDRAVKLDPNDAQAYADSGAAWLEKGKLELERAKVNNTLAESGKGVEYFARSLQDLNKALNLSNNFLEPLFNRALVHELLGLLPQAEEDWRTYLEKDPNSKWADEARQKLGLIEQQRKTTSLSEEEIFREFVRAYEAGDEERIWGAISGYQKRTGNLVVEKLLDTYLEGKGKNGKGGSVSQALEILKRVAQLDASRSADRFFVNVAEFYDSATPRQLTLAAAAREMMKQGYAGWGRVRVQRSLDLFSTAKELFEQCGNLPEARVAEYWMSFCHYRQHDQDQSREILYPLLLTCESRDYKWLQIRGLYLLSIIEFDLNEHSKAVDLGLQASELARRTNDSVGALNAAGALIEYYRYLASYPKSLGWIQQSLPLVTSTPLDPIQGARHFSLAAFAFATIGLHDAAAAFQREALRFALETGSDAVKSQNYAFLGAINGKLKKFGEALRNAELAAELAQAQSAEPAGRGLVAYVALQTGNIYREAGELDKAVVQYTQAIQLYETFPDFQTHLFQAHKGRLFCYSRQQNDELTQTEISTLLSLMEKYRSKISDENSRNTFFDVEQSVVDTAIDFEYSRMNNPQRAFEYLSTSQARTLFDLLNADKEVRAKVHGGEVKLQEVSAPLPLEKILQHMPEHAHMLQYVILRDKILIWVIARDAFQVREVQIDQIDFNKKLRRYLSIVSNPPQDNEPEELSLAKELYELLIQPVERLLDKGKLLCIIPDRTLNYLPFAALISSEGKHLFEEYVLMSSQSPSVFVSCTENAAHKSGAIHEKILSVGNPSFDRKAFPELEDLPAARNEAIAIGQIYDSPLPLVADRAVKAEIIRNLATSEVVHLALHSKIDEEVPLRSRLLLATTRFDAGNSDAVDMSANSVLYAHEIYGLSLPSTRLVVLSSCQSGAERYYGGEGMISLARAFIGAGVPMVVASLWPVDSAATRDLMISFHKHRKQGLATVEALTRAQQDTLSGPERFRRPYYWAAFSVTGGYAEF